MKPPRLRCYAPHQMDKEKKRRMRNKCKIRLLRLLIRNGHWLLLWGEMQNSGILANESIAGI